MLRWRSKCVPSTSPWLASSSARMISPMYPVPRLSFFSTLVSASAFSPMRSLLCIINCICSRRLAEVSADPFAVSLSAFRISLMASFKGSVMLPMFSVFASLSLWAFCSSTCRATLAMRSCAALSCSLNCLSR